MKREQMFPIFLSLLACSVFAQNVDFGVNLSLSMPSSGKFVSNDYVEWGWFDNTIYDPPTPFEVLSIVSRWNIEPDMQFGGGAFVTYWTSSKIGARLNLNYSVNSGIASKVTANYIFYDWINYDSVSRSHNFDACNQKGSLKTFKINPGVQFNFGKTAFSGVSLFAGPSIFVDNFEVIFDVPYIFTWDDPSFYYIGARTTPLPSSYEASKTAIGGSFALLGRMRISPGIFLEGSFFIDLGKLPAYDEVEEYLFVNTPAGLNNFRFTVSNDTEGILRNVGFEIGMGFYPSPVSHIDSDGDGVWDEFDLCPGTPRGTVVDERGCERKVIQKKEISYIESEFESRGVYISNEIFFEFNSDEITPESYPVLDDIGRILERHRGWKLEIAGHTDAIGTDDYNNKLSLRRAKSVKNYLVKNFNIIPENLSAMGYGESKPIATNDTNEGRALNRRVEFRILE